LRSRIFAAGLSPCRNSASGVSSGDMMAGGAIDFSDFLPPISLSPILAYNLSEKDKKRDTLSH
jgi:hypothetical protein